MDGTENNVLWVEAEAEGIVMEGMLMLGEAALFWLPKVGALPQDLGTGFGLVLLASDGTGSMLVTRGLKFRSDGFVS